MKDTYPPSYVTTYRRGLELVRSRYPQFFVHLILVLLLMISIAAVGAAVPYLLRQTTNLLVKESGEGIVSMIYVFATAYAVGWTLSNMMEWGKNLASSYVMARCDAAVYSSVVRRLLRLPYQAQHQLDTGVVMADVNRAMSSFGLINHAIFWTITPVVIQLCFVFGILWQVINLTFAVAFILAIVALFMLTYRIADATTRIHKNFYQTHTQLSEFLAERLRALYDIKINLAVGHEERTLDQHLRTYVHTVYGTHAKLSGLMGGQVLAVGLVLGGFTLYTVSETLRQRYQVGDFIMITNYVVQLTSPFVMIAAALIDLKKNYVALDDGLRYLDLPTEPQSASGIILDHRQPVFTLRNVTLRADDATSTMPLSAEIQAGNMYGVRGPSGSGKSTLLRTLLGLVTQEAGEICFYGVNIRQLSPNDILNEVSVVPQAPLIFSGSVRENLLYAHSKPVSDEELLELVELLDLKRVGGGSSGEGVLDRSVGIQGRNLSGGEQQRIAIGRALLRGTRTMILDEPTAALDSVREIQLMQALRERIETLIVVSHREQVLELADEFIEVGLCNTPIQATKEK
ncbi:MULTISPECIES: ABC transporter ATP-binding protein [unclassified Modicisalibacter]|uniref:ATP-binding cassette domain-containing protein n=1 Tax=unclassified Modicisalibacter TaxID=2679913 RepID=UPI001CC9A1FA|nr:MULTISPECIES: ABC transporter ATP-binding protein [unclassified Modicisalibacter]MBZ9559706.1 ABC transporter ATP-binding protein [Modicisalibacter sp. R2A 31.J]MBZ9577158.1 ABC transporter ATP-binding protein [Modicisalibacter sp. MOD 31.J]